MILPDWLWVLLVFGTVARLTKLLHSDTITEPLRDWVKSHAVRAIRRDALDPRPVRRNLWHFFKRRYRSFWHWLNGLLACPWCISVWMGAAVAYVVVWWPTNRVLIGGMLACTGSLIAAIIAGYYAPDEEDE